MRLRDVTWITIVGALFTFSTASAQLPLDLIECFHSDTANGRLARGCTSPGDLDGDGYSEIFVAEYEGEERLHVFSGGNPPDTFPDMLIGNYGAIHTWVPDINGDGIQDFAMLESYKPEVDVVQIWFGGTDFLSRSGPDLLLKQARDTVSYFGRTIASGDVNGDGQNDLVIAAVNGEVYPYDGRFYIYYGGDILDTFVDEAISFYDKGNGYNDFWAGNAVGDMNGDDLVDYVWTGKKDGSAGYVSVMYGRIPMDSVADHTVWSPFTGGYADNFGQTIHPLGDIDKDGCSDFAITGPWACVFFGGEPFDTIPLILGDTTNLSTQGRTAANIGDINHDGWDDIAVGYPYLDLGSGVVHIYYGYREMDGVVDLVLHHSDVSPTVGYLYGDNIGTAGDFNGDGVDDLVVTSMGSSNYNWAKGNVYVYAGDSTLPVDADEFGDEGPLPDRFDALQQNYPNPFNSGTTIEYTLTGISEMEVELTIHNILGQTVKTLRLGMEKGGRHVIQWDGTDDDGDPVPSGVYFYVLESGEQRSSKKLLLLR